jgi:hypothetical protein
MSYDIEISRRTTDPYTEEGEWMEGDSREIRDHGTDTETYDPEFDDQGSPAAWAVERIRRTGTYEPSVSPVPAELHDSAWLSCTIEDNYTTQREEVSVRLSGAWTPAERAEVFRLVSAS